MSSEEKMEGEGRVHRFDSVDGDDVDPLSPAQSTNPSRQPSAPHISFQHNSENPAIPETVGEQNLNSGTEGAGFKKRGSSVSTDENLTSSSTNPSDDDPKEEEDMVSKLVPVHNSNPSSGAWNVSSFRGESDAPQFEQRQQGRIGSTTRRPTGYVRKGSVAAKEALRKGSTIAVDAIQSLEMGREIGNPLQIKVNEKRRLSSVAFRRSEDFDGRTAPNVQGRKPSMFGRIPSIVPPRDVDPDEYEIQRLAAHDDIDHMAPWARALYRTAPFWGVISLILYWAYFGLRIRFTLAAQDRAGRIFGMAWAFIAVEIGVAIPMVLHRVWSMLVLRGRRRPKLRLLGNSVPSVDVVITCCGEEDSLVFDTAKAACNVDYPSDRFRVVILDDGNSAGLRELVENGQHPFDNMHYRSRPKFPGVPHHFKAGNLNYGLGETKVMRGGAANFVAALDADMIPERDWLRALLPHMLQDLKCSMACPPQLFYNVPEDDPLCQSLDTFVHISEPVKDALGVAWCTGSGYIMRRDALDSIGLFPLGSLAEDVCTSSMLLGAGWRTAFVHEPLQWGTVPESLSGHLKQRTRWTIGTVQTSLKLRFCLYGPLVKHMSIMQRASGFVYTVSSLFTIFLVASLFTVPVVLVSGGNMVPYSTINQLRWLVRFCFMTMLSNRLNEFIVYLPSGYRVGQRDARGMMWMAPYHALSVIQSFLLPKWLGGKIAVFTSSGSQSSELNERDARLRAPLLHRLRVTIIDYKAFLHLGYICFVISAITFSMWHTFHDHQNNSAHKRAVYVLTHAGWPPVLWLICLVSCWAPIQYAIRPPTMPDREELLTRDAKTGVAYPTKKSRVTKGSRWHLLHELQYSLMTVYTTALFVLSWWL